MTSTRDPEIVSVARVRRAIAKRLRAGKSALCPCCGRKARMRHGHISASMARTLLKIYGASPREPFQCRSIFARDQNGDYAKLRYWGLLKRAGLGAGWWQLTALGRAFVRGEAEVPATALTYNRRLFALVGDPISIQDCFANKGDFEAMVASTKGRAKS